MNSKAKTLLKVGLPLVIVIQLISITFLLAKMSRDKAFSCKAVGNYFVCKQIKLKWYIKKVKEAQVRMLKMEPIRVRCRVCSKEVKARAGKSVCCGCSNMTTIKGDVISAVDLSLVIMLNTYSVKEDSGLSNEQLEWQKARSRRKITKMDFEVR